MKKWIVLCVAVATCQVSAAQSKQEIKKKLVECQERKIKTYRTPAKFSQPGEATCSAGDIVNFSCRKDDKTVPLTYTAPADYKIVTANIAERSKTSRASYSPLAKTDLTATTMLSCNGHGCDRKERVWVKVDIVGTIERIPSEADRRTVSDQCIDEVIK